MRLYKGNSFESDLRRYACFAKVEYGKYVSEPHTPAVGIDFHITATVISNPKKFEPSPTEYVEVRYECRWLSGCIEYVRLIPRKQTWNELFSCTGLWLALCSLFECNSFQTRDPSSVTEEEYLAARDYSLYKQIEQSPVASFENYDKTVDSLTREGFDYPNP